MNKNGKTNVLVIVAIVAIAALALWYFVGGNGIVPSKGYEEITNGYYDTATGQCWPDKDHPVGGEYPIGNIQTNFYQCCLNQKKSYDFCYLPRKSWDIFCTTWSYNNEYRKC